MYRVLVQTELVAAFTSVFVADLSIVRECLSDVLTKNNEEVEGVVLPNFRSLLYVCLVMITLANAQLFRELQYHKKTVQFLKTIQEPKSRISILWRTYERGYFVWQSILFFFYNILFVIISNVFASLCYDPYRQLEARWEKRRL